jgi:hypothetical protein
MTYVESKSSRVKYETRAYVRSRNGMSDQPVRGTIKQKQIQALWEQVRNTPRDLMEERVSIPGIGIRRVQVIFAPSFELGFAWDIRVFGDAEWRLFRSKIVEVTEENLGEPTRIVGYEQLDISGDTLRGYFDRLMSLRLPIGPLLNGMSGLDGTSFHLALFGDMHSEIRFGWWSEPPPQWGPLIGVANEMIEGFLKLQPKGLEPSSS